MGYVAEKGRELAVGGIKGLLKKLWDESKPGVDRSGVNRFRYDAGNVRLFGRDDELTFLWEFCHSDSHFSWFAISGEGGSGKTRLAYTLGKLLKYAPGWSYRKVDYARPDGLAAAKQALKDAPQNTLLVLDYVKWHTDSIGKWLYDLWCDWHERNLKIRVLLVERDAISPRDLRWQHDVMAAQYRPEVDAPFLDDNNLMRLRPLNDNDMISVVNDYADAFEKQVDARLVISTLKKIDPNFQRPLYVLFLADAELDEENNLNTWDEKNALEYVYNKERERVEKNIDELKKNTQDTKDLTEIAFRALLTATLSGGLEWDKYCQLHFEDVDVLQSLSSHAERTGQRLLSVCLGIPYDEDASLFITPLEPDLMGEFFCIQELWKLKDNRRQKSLDLAMLNDLRRAAVVFDRIVHDYLQLLTAREMNGFFAELHLPEGIDEVPEEAFGGIENLKRIVLPISISRIGFMSFCDCCALESILLPKGLTYIGGCAFNDCGRLESIGLPDTVTDIRPFAFVHSGLTSIEIPASVTTIHAGLFQFCRKLKHVQLPDSVTSIGIACFQCCSSLTAIELPQTITCIEEESFDGSGIKTITIPQSVRYIEKNAFRNSALECVAIFDTIELIVSNAFSYCEQLKRVCVYGNLTDVIQNAFKSMNVILHELPKEEAKTCISPPNAV